MKHLIIKGSLLLAYMAAAPVITPAAPLPFLQEKSGVHAQSKKEKSGTITYKVIRAAGNSYGYDIYVDCKLYIHQTTIPGMQGKDGFQSKEAAEKTAQLVKEKLTKGETRPTVTVAELKQLKAI